MDGVARLRAAGAYLRFRADLALGPGYQPLPWLGVRRARRGRGTLARWRAIAPLLDAHPIASAADIGCQIGFFPLALARQGIPAVGIDTDARALRIARYAAARLGLTNTAWWHLRVTPETARLLPTVDLTLVLSIWHHWVHDYGLDGANALLGTVWARTRTVLCFETGERELPAAWGLPAMAPSPRAWLYDLLAAQCPGGTVQHLGAFRAFAPGGDERRRVVYRNLFAVTRTA